MNNKCVRCGTIFSSPYCPKCGAQAQYVNNHQGRQTPPSMPRNSQYPNNNFGPGINTQPPKKKHGCLFYGLIISGSVMVLLFGLLFVAAFISTFNDTTVITTNDRPDREVPTESPVITITSTELIAIYKENQVKCKQLYNNQLLEITGTVQSVGTDIMDNTYVCLGSDSEYTFVGIQCYAKDEEVVNKIANLKEGDVITVRGKGDCGSLSFSIENAEIVD